MEPERGLRRRQILGAVGAAAATGLAGCAGLRDVVGGGTDPDRSQDIEIPPLAEFRGSGALIEGRPAPSGTSIQDLPDLSGSLNLYIGGGEGGIYYQFVEMLEEIYPDFQVFSSSAASSSLAQTIVEEVGSQSAQADVFWSIDASSLGYVADNNAYESLPNDVVDPVPSSFRGSDNAWVGVAGRARSIPYNSEQLSEDDIPASVMDIPETDALLGTMGWAPTYGAFKSFVTAMRLLEGPETTREWLVSLREAGTQRFPNEFVVSNQVADGTLGAGFANHYYALRVKNSRPDAPIDLAFTKNDAGALVNVAGALRIKGTQKDELVNDFIRHLLSAEAQEYFATVSFAYPMISGVAPPGGLPTVDELNPPDIDIAALADLEPTLELMREAGVSG
ncbi:ABC-type Fe3+ transport system, periplasmic component [Halanaeroarchaeum sp. HSR-CO]|uniref:extracellular solute-binding protein n=1 Tax=Halanaeroarchaeum sp. HSR-CO TaxID=2866382 RepID=UPI00217EE818|nr:extracellular solute-binding protein [Halanaeroarchaeum sp. HSR-CO]UWG47854.1 ABC-type Fe3+ transport system, periplasmic component [Halanaeroarchaeum sp. HSR-CO]